MILKKPERLWRCTVNTVNFREYDAVQFLDNEETINAYIEQALTDTSPRLLLSTISNVVRARAINQLAEKTGFSRKIIYEALRQDSNPKQEVLTKIVNALNVNQQIVSSENI